MTMSELLNKRRRRFRAAGLIAAAAAVLATPVLAQPPSAGKLLARRNCAQCHAVERTGNSPMARAPRFRDLAEITDMNQLIDAIRKGLLTRHPAMPELRLSPKEINDLAAYLRGIQVQKETRLDAARALG